MCSVIIFMMYKITKKIKVPDFIGLILIIFSTYIMRDYFTIDYNWATSLMLLIIIYLEIPKEKTETLILNKKKDLIIGILAGMCIMFKQSTGALIAISAVGYKIFEIKNRNQIKDFLKIVMYRAIGVLIPVVLIFAYLIINGAFSEFLDYCLYGISTFSNKISYERLIKSKNIIIKILSYSPIILIIIFGIYFVKKQKEFLFLTFYGLAGLSVVYPIADESHFVIGIIPCLIIIGHLSGIIVGKILDKINIKEKVNFVLSNVLITFIILECGYYMYHKVIEMNDLNFNSEIRHYIGTPISQNQIDRIKEVDEFILSNEKVTYILDAQAALYMIPIDKYNKNYDMFLKGNIGGKGEEGLIEDLKRDNKKTVLILSDKFIRNWQTPEKVINYIKKDMKRTGTIGVFDIYE